MRLTKCKSGGVFKTSLSKKGFTLLEVLAVIIVLAVIALITVPIVTSTMKDARKSSFKTSMLNLVKAANHYYADNQLDITSPIAFDFIRGGASEDGKELSFKGTKPKTGRLIINVDGEITLQDVSDGNYYANYNSSSDDDVIVTNDNEILTRDELSDELRKLKKELANTKTELQAAINKKSNQSDMDKVNTQLTSTTNLVTIANNTVNTLSTNVSNNYVSRSNIADPNNNIKASIMRVYDGGYGTTNMFRRDYVATPTEYKKNSAGIYTEFKNASAVGISNIGNYVTLITVNPYGSSNDFSGGDPYQFAIASGGTAIYKRGISSTTAWGSWQKIH